MEQGGCKYSVQEESELPAAIAPLYKHAQESLRKCRDIETAMTNLETQASSDATYFPVVAGKKRRLGDHHSSSPSSTAPITSSRNGLGKPRLRDSRSPQLSQSSSLSNMCLTSSSSLLQFPDSVKVCVYVCVCVWASHSCTPRCHLILVLQRNHPSRAALWGL